MNRKKIITLITIFAIAIAAMFILQAIWFDSVFTLKQNDFRREIASSLEKIPGEFHGIANQGDFEGGDKRTRELYTQIYTIRKSIQDSKFVTYEYSDRYAMIHGGDYKYYWNMTISLDSLIVLFRKAYFESINENSFKIEAQYYQKYAPCLDSLILEKLRAYNKEQPFDYGIYDPSEQYFIYKKGEFTQNAIEQSFKTMLNPDDVFFPPKYLFVYFPKEKVTLIGEMKWILFMCLILTIIITGIFAYAASIILQQRESVIKKRDFGRNMTHEFRVPITTINLSCDILNEPDVQNSKPLIKKYVNIISAESKRLQNMVEKILHAVKMNKPDLDLEKKKVSIKEIINNSISSLQFQIDEKDATVRTSFEEKDDEIMADPVFLTNAVINIIENALKYSRDNCIVNIIVKDDDKTTKIIIEDNGIGISKIQQTMIFEKLYRAPVAEVQNTTGFGLGLNYVAAVIEQHGGKIEVESELKVGTRFIIYLPK